MAFQGHGCRGYMAHQGLHNTTWLHGIAVVTSHCMGYMALDCIALQWLHVTALVAWHCWAYVALHWLHGTALVAWHYRGYRHCNGCMALLGLRGTAEVYMALKRTARVII